MTEQQLSQCVSLWVCMCVCVWGGYLEEEVLGSGLLMAPGLML